MKVVFRVDASLQIGSGHVMRCLTLADALREQGAQCWFVSRAHRGNILKQVRERGFEVAVLSAGEAGFRPAKGRTEPNIAHAAWLGCGWETDAEQTRHHLARIRPEWLIVDHYALDARWEGALRPYCDKVMVIDDLADRSHNCELLLDQNMQAPGRYAGLVSDATTTLIGPKYSLLRPQFGDARQGLRVRNGHVSRLLVFFGGTDAGGEILKALSAIENVGRSDLAVDVVVGEGTPHRSAIEAVCRSLCNVTLHWQVDNMAALMSAADLFVGAGGTSAWERCCMALPALVLATADNQITQSEALARAGAHLYLGPVHSVTKEQLARLIEETLRLPDLLLHMAEQGRNIVDGRGSIRVANRIKSFAPIRLRRAESGDSRSLFDWRNHPSTRRYALDPTEIEWDVHERWVAAVLADPDRELLIAEQEGRPVGVLRYDISVDRARISIYLVPGMAGHGLGPRILLAGEEWLQDHWLTVRVLEAEIRPENLASLGAFLSAGFTHEHSVLRKSIHGIH